MTQEIEVQEVRVGRSGLIMTVGIVLVLIIGLGGGFLFKAWIDDANGPNATDVGFAQDMAVHHDQAVQIAGIALAGSTDPQVRSVAWDIVTGQSNQIGQMRGWLSGWGKPLFAPDGYMGWMPMPGATDKMPMATMPGMASDAQMAALRAATGRDLDVMFLNLMIAHHEGGAAMTDYAAHNARIDAVRTFADLVFKSQSSEVALMTKLLEARAGA